MMEEQIGQQSHQNLNQVPTIYKIKQYRSKSFLGQFSFMLIRPPRFLYNQKLLALPEQYESRFKLEQHLIPFKLTLYKVQNMQYVILYLHGNSSSRFQGYMHLKQLPLGVGLACFDFNGCGMRFDSDYITLGVKQSKQVDTAASHLKKLGYKVVGWGRSMGSVSLLLSQQCDILVADSPFSSLQDLCKQSSSKFVPSVCCCFFHCLYPCFFSCVKSDIRQKADLDLQQLQIAKKIANNPRNKQRSLFLMAGKQDGMINFSHAQKIFEAFPGKKEIQLFEGTHNSNRPSEVYDKCFFFIHKQLGLIPNNSVQNYLKMNSNNKKHNIRLKPIQKPCNGSKNEQAKQQTVQNESMRLQKSTKTQKQVSLFQSGIIQKKQNTTQQKQLIQQKDVKNKIFFGKNQQELSKQNQVNNQIQLKTIQKGKEKSKMVKNQQPGDREQKIQDRYVLKVQEKASTLQSIQTRKIINAGKQSKADEQKQKQYKQQDNSSQILI